MAVRIVEHDTMAWMGVREGIPGDERGLSALPDFDDGSAGRFPHPGSGGELYLHEGRIPPDTAVELHAHRSDEIIYVLSGELRLGARSLGPGTSVYIPGMTFYGFRSGPSGLRFLDFRGQRDVSHLTKDEFLRERHAEVGDG